ncbi:MAG: hypothetical protein K2X87_23780 [Gemmataceae bacterium]|nr:hypothetical protein [Gemmataceae bacterium]
MSKPFDATLNALIDARLADWVAFLAPKVGLAPGPAEVLDTDLSVTAQADKAFRLAGPPAAVLHLELEANPRRGIPADLLRYNVLLGHGHDLPVYTVIVLLRPKAEASDLTGLYRRPKLHFEYEVVRLWRESVDGLLAGGPAMAPLALLTDEAAADIPAAVGRLATRLRQPGVDAKLVGEVLTSTYFLSGLRHDPNRIRELIMRTMGILEESTTYQEVIGIGAVRGARRLLLVMGQKKFGPAPEGVAAALDGIADPDRLERMAERILDAAGWDDLLATP